MDKNMWDNYFKFMKPETASSNEINAWLQNTMHYMDDFMTFSKKVCEMKATPDDIMLLWENSSKKIQGSMSDCMKMFGMADNSESEETEKKLAAANKTIEDQKKKIKDQDKDISAQKKEADKLNQLLADKDKEISAQKKDVDKLNQLLADQKKEISKLQQTIASLEAAAVKAATPKTNQ
ncbi:hypothetical protein [Desulforegula conservatrix]|uniref:hypothetical protein n=1 Tax=Desulforegula conservatrix TaxID=153026 RepID=UPI0003F6EC06|nr:hypothetical protein [Desulforegula conservatrix]